jgi:uncharacterized protein (DUF58 family)
MAARPPLGFGADFLLRLERLELSVRRLRQGEPRGDVPVARRGPGLLFEDHRPYTAGDDPRLLDWNAYLRLGDLLVRESAAEEAPRLVCLVDASASMGLGDRPKLRTALEIAAAMGVVALSRNSSVTMLASPGAAGAAVFRGRTAITALLEHCAGCAASPGRFLAGGQGVDFLQRPGTARGVVLALSDFLSDGGELAVLSRLRRRGYVVHAVQIADRRDADVRAGDTVVLVDVETGRRRRERIDGAIARDYAQALRDHDARLRAACHARELVLTRHEVSEPMEGLVVGLLRKGALLA